MTTVKDLWQELGVTNNEAALEQIIKLKLGYQPWRDRRGELLSQPTLTDGDKQELADLEDKLTPLGWRAAFGNSYADIQAMEIIREAGRLLKK